MKDTKPCRGCNDDFCNGGGGATCWLLKKAKIVPRFEIGTWTLPGSPGAFSEVVVPNCYHAKGRHFYKDLPSFVKAEDVRRRR